MTRMLAVFAAAVLLPACMIELEHRIACGDGHVDRRAGEQCDPEDPERAFERICDEAEPGAIGSCDPSTCQLDESTCEPCGNGRVDPDEECDPKNQGDIDDIAIGRLCAGSPGGSADEMLPLTAPYPPLPYASGSTSRCLPDCTYDRTPCGYCGNGRAENYPILVSLETQTIRETLPEWCDGEDFDPDRRAAHRPCGDGGVANVECADDCLSFLDRPGPLCCLPPGADCPAEDAVARCCHEFAEPDAAQHCSDPFLVPGTTPPPGSGGSKCN
ncbi:MAG: hypothetical protein IAG13_29745 [Deltaproteobacteria bacterium]|nr:hypothetical protein [Nannocystaceae bacterium]